MKKLIERFGNIKGKNIGTKRAQLSTCMQHDPRQMPFLKPLEYCLDHELGMCYMCSNIHIDGGCHIDWGYDIFQDMEAPHNLRNSLFNQGFRTIYDFSKIRCPCGQLAQTNTTAICTVCGSVTCSAECHSHYIQSKGKCLFIRNFSSNPETKNIQGLRNILYINVRSMQAEDLPTMTKCSRISPKFMSGHLGPSKDTIYVQRGFRQYGQPLPETLEGMTVLDDEEDELYQIFLEKVCLCGCSYCVDLAPHPVKSCVLDCLLPGTATDMYIRSQDLSQKCVCSCDDCKYMPKHTKLECLKFCQNAPFRALPTKNRET